MKIGSTGFIGVLVPSQRASSVTSPSQQRQLQIDGNNSGSGGPPSGACLPNDQSAGVPDTIAPVGSGTLVLGDLCGTPADQVGITAGDVITAVNGRPVSSPDTLTQVLSDFRPGSTVSVTWVDTGGQSHTHSLSLIQAPPL